MDVEILTKSYVETAAKLAKIVKAFEARNEPLPAIESH
jgi:hypothetical protein